MRETAVGRVRPVVELRAPKLLSASRGPGCCVSLESASSGGHRQVRPASGDGASDCPCSPHGSTMFWNPMDPACGARHLELALSGEQARLDLYAGP